MIKSIYKTETIQHKGNFPHHCTESYCEIKCVNYLHEDLLIINNRNEPSSVPRSNLVEGPIKRVEIMIRWVHGVRKLSRNGTNEEWTGPITKITLLREDLVKNPIYVKELDMLFCLRCNFDNALHPNSDSTYEKYIDVISETLLNDFNKPPVIIHANDPTKRINKLYCIINEIICCFKVSNILSEDAICKIGHKEDIDLESYSYINLDLEEIISGNGEIKVGTNVFFISPNRGLLQNKLMQLTHEKYSKCNLNIEELVKIHSEKLYEEINSLKDNLTLTKDKLKHNDDQHKLEEKKLQMLLDDKDKQYEQLENIIKFKDEIEKKNLEHESYKNKLINEQLENERKINRQRQEEEVQKFKLEKEKHASRINLLSNIIKAGSVIIPIAATTIMYIMKKKQDK